jgi:hypothetical protein
VSESLLESPVALPAPRTHSSAAASIGSGRSTTCDLLAALVVGLFFFASWSYFVPAHSGVDQNGYLVGGRMFAENLSMEYRPILPGARTEFDPHQFVGRMWVGAELGTPRERYFPKYPLGYPFLVAAALWVGGEGGGPIAAYWINPVAMVLAVAATYLLVRQVAGALPGLCATLIFASSPVTMGLATNPNSHATAVCAVTWGMYLLLRWWKLRGRARAIAAGLLLGYAATIRYTEATLVLPILLVLAFTLRRASWREAGMLLLGWTIPVVLLVICNLATMGTVTGYDSTNESLGFSLDYAAENWETMIRQLGGIGLYFIFPFSVLGLLWMFWWEWKLASVLAAWIVPCMLVYTFYYWAPDPLAAQQQGVYISYLRFFLTIMPALVACAFWLFAKLIELAKASQQPAPLAAASLAMGVATCVSLAVHLRNSTFAAEEDQNRRLLLKMNADEVLAAAPPHAVIFAADTQLLHQLQFVRDYSLYNGETFNRTFVQNLPNVKPDEPQGWEPGRRESLYKRLKDVGQPQLDDQARRIINAALASGRRVFFVAQGKEDDPTVRRRRASAQSRSARVADIVTRFATPDRFETELIAGWNQPIVRPAQNEGRQRNKRPDMRGVERRNTFWQIVEVTKKPPAAATSPTTRAK